MRYGQKLLAKRAWQAGAGWGGWGGVACFELSCANKPKPDELKSKRKAVEAERGWVKGKSEEGGRRRRGI